MSWASLANNQTISFSNLLSAVESNVFVQKALFPNPFPYLEQITKADADTYVNINTSFPSYAAKSSNQLVVKSNLQASIRTMGLSAERDEAFDTCFVPFTVVQNVTYSGNLGIGTQIENVTILGNLGYFLIITNYWEPLNVLYSIGINDNGIVFYLEALCPF
jgi:hypothetical protein